jgi:tetratricopeptide (TPR) repeat protein
MVAFKRVLRIGCAALLVLLTTAAGTQSPRQSPVSENPTAVPAYYQKQLQVNPQSSLAYYQLAEVLFAQRKYQASANSCRDALRGDGYPSWTKVWSHIQLGEIFDLTGQRDRAVMEYKLALKTEDDTRGSLDKARSLLQAPYGSSEPH